MAQRLTILEKQRRWRWLSLGFAPVSALCAVMGISNPRLDWTTRAVALLACGVIAFLVITYFRRVGRRAKEKMSASNWSGCLYCCFDLQGLGTHGNCPECGEAYDIDRVRAEWKKAPLAAVEAMRKHRG